MKDNRKDSYQLKLPSKVRDELDFLYGKSPYLFNNDEEDEEDCLAFDQAIADSM